MNPKSASASRIDRLAAMSPAPQPVLDGINRSRRLRGTGKKQLRQHEVDKAVTDLVREDLLSCGELYHDDVDAYVFLREQGLLLTLDIESTDLRMLMFRRYDFGPTEADLKSIIGRLHMQTLLTGHRTTVHLLSHYDRRKSTLYLSNLGGSIYRISPGQVELVPNGTDGVLFATRPQWEPFELLDDMPDDDHSPIHELLLGPIRFAEGPLAPDQQRLTLMLWLYSMFFPELHFTRPILALIGDRGSGKTSALRRIGQTIFGRDFNVTPMPDDPKDFDAAVTNEQFVAIDNADSRRPWQEDRLAVACTGGKISRRKLYTTNEMVEYPVSAWLALTSRTPTFKREDVADRLVPLHLDRHQTFTPESEILSEIRARRNELMTELVWHLYAIVAALHAQRTHRCRTSLRLADFGDFGLRVARAQGWSNKMKSILGVIGGKQLDFATDDDPLIEVIGLWLRDDPERNVDREMAPEDLLRELRKTAEACEIACGALDSTRSLAQSIRGRRSSLENLYGLSERTLGGRRRLRSFKWCEPVVADRFSAEFVEE